MPRSFCKSVANCAAWCAIAKWSWTCSALKYWIPAPTAVNMQRAVNNSNYLLILYVANISRYNKTKKIHFYTQTYGRRQDRSQNDTTLHEHFSAFVTMVEVGDVFGCDNILHVYVYARKQKSKVTKWDKLLLQRGISRTCFWLHFTLRWKQSKYYFRVWY